MATPRGDYERVNLNGALGGFWLPSDLAKASLEQRSQEARAARRALERGRVGAGMAFSSRWQTSATVLGDGHDKPPGTVPFPLLRLYSRVSIIDRLIIDAIKAQARRFARICAVPKKQLGFRVVHRLHEREDFDSATPDILRRCAEMEKLIESPTDPPHPSFSDYLLNALEERLVLDRRVVVLPQDRAGRPSSYHLVDGATIKPRLEVLMPHMVVDGQWRSTEYEALARLQSMLWMAPPRDERGVERNVDLTEAEYVQVVDDRIVGAWKKGEVVVAIANSTVRLDHWGYGYSPLEASLALSVLFSQALAKNAALFDVEYPEAILAIRGDYTQQGLGALHREVMDYYNVDEARSRIPIISGDDLEAQILPLKETPRDMLMTELIRILAKFKCAAYRVHPSLINVDEASGQIQIGYGGDESAIAQAVGDGFHGYLTDEADLLDRALVRRNNPDLATIVEGLEVEDQNKRTQRITTDLSIKTLNEVRRSEGLKPLPKKLPEAPGDYVLNPSMMQVYSMQQMAEQQEAGADMGGYEQGDFGQPPGGAGQPWGASGGPGGGQGGNPGDRGGSPQEVGWEDAEREQEEAGNPHPGQGGAPVRKSLTVTVEGDDDDIARLLGGW